jgi:hypothetical protein
MPLASEFELVESIPLVGFVLALPRPGAACGNRLTLRTDRVIVGLAS